MSTLLFGALNTFAFPFYELGINWTLWNYDHRINSSDMKEKDHLILYNKEIIMSKYRHKHFIDLTVKLGVNHLYVIIFSVTRSDKSSNLTHFI